MYFWDVPICRTVGLKSTNCYVHEIVFIKNTIKFLTHKNIISTVELDSRRLKSRSCYL